MAVLEKEDFWGGKLSKSSPEVKFNPEFEDSELSEVDHKLILSQACLGSKASGRNVVEVTAIDFQGNECKHTIVSLREGTLEMCTLNLTFNPPATFKLVEGSGPVHLTGSHIQSLAEEDEEESDEEEEEDSDEEVPDLVDTKKQLKRPLPSSTPKGPPNKVAKVEEEESDDEESDEEEDESDEEEEESKKPADKKDKKQESKKPSKFLEKEAEEGEESDEDSDEEMDEDEDDESDEEEEDDDSDDEEESDEEEDEVTATLTGKKKQADKKPMTNGVGPKNAGKEAKTPQAKTPKSKTPQSKTPQSKTPQPTKDIETIKQALVKSPALPKKIEKFTNFMRSSYKITDKDTVKDLWDYVQKSKK